VAYFKVLPRNSSEGSAEIHQEIQSQCPAPDRDSNHELYDKGFSG